MNPKPVTFGAVLMSMVIGFRWLSPKAVLETTSKMMTRPRSPAGLIPLGIAAMIPGSHAARMVKKQRPLTRDTAFEQERPLTRDTAFEEQEQGNITYYYGGTHHPVDQWSCPTGTVPVALS